MHIGHTDIKSIYPSLPLHKYLYFKLDLQHHLSQMSQKACKISSSNCFCKLGLIRIFSSKRFYVSPSHNFYPCHKVFCKRSNRIYFNTEVLLFCEHIYAPIMRASDINYVSTYPICREGPKLALNQDTRIALFTLCNRKDVQII